MNKDQILSPNRRHFLSKGLGGCTLLCLAGSSGLPLIGQEQNGKKESTKAHIFDTKLPRPFTYRQLFNLQYAEFIKIVQVMIKEFGEERVLQILKENTRERMFKYGQDQAKRMGDNSFANYVKQFKAPDSYKFSLKKEVVEDTEKVLELKVTQCIWATTFLNRKAGKIGFAAICYGDYSWPQGFNPKIKMIRDKTLMEGHSCCNHRYILNS